ncbi:hypothetical protein JI664_12740 [Rhodobacter sp. NTK016B]|uniref:hypothetical protein n=1 Tax=Rhodobacter sp. NTK016B TaxID=2759676 RepID=UPI001A8F30AE|nr:hypothetical protein [Rhodobacter sp. NTK016B]MBN8292834.1 hypothetical protein [Rhodobacter sp. NTK016B]
MKMNNLSARLIANAWLVKQGHEALPDTLTYEQFATELRKVSAAGSVQQAFASRADACAYVRNFASMKRREVQ